MQLMRLLVGIQSLIHQLPGSLYAQPKEQYLIAVHSGSSLLIPQVIWHGFLDKFHSKRRGASQNSLASASDFRRIDMSLGVRATKYVDILE